MAPCMKLSLVLAALSTNFVAAGDWPQFRGPNGSGLAVGQRKLPSHVGPGQNVLWKTALPP